MSKRKDATVSYKIPCEDCGAVQDVGSVKCAACSRKAEKGPYGVMDLRLWIERMSPVFGNEFGVWIVGRDPASRKRLRSRIVFDEVPVEEGDSVSESFRLKNSEVQRIMDNLWSAGVRPSSGDGNEGALKAVQDHLKDMRDIAFQKLRAPNMVIVDGKVIEVDPKESSGVIVVDPK